jgi:transposase
VQLVSSRDVKNVPGRPGTDKLDCAWQAKLTERGHAAAQLRPAAGDPPAAGLHPAAAGPDPGPVRHAQRIEKLLEALIKLSPGATDIMGKSGRAMIGALIAGERDPQVLAGLAAAGCGSGTPPWSRP